MTPIESSVQSSGESVIGGFHRVPKVTAVELLISAFEAEVFYESDTPEPELETQAEHVRLWNEGRLL